MSDIMGLFREHESIVLGVALLVLILLLLFCCICITCNVKRRRRKGGQKLEPEAGHETEPLLGVTDDVVEDHEGPGNEKKPGMPEVKKVDIPSVAAEPQEEQKPAAEPSPPPPEEEKPEDVAPAPETREETETTAAASPSPPPSPLPEARLILPYKSTGTGKSLTKLRDQLETDLQDLFGTFERTDDEELEGEEDDGPVIEENSNWIFDIPMADTSENRESLLGLATWLKDAAELEVLYLKYPNGEEVNLNDE